MESIKSASTAVLFVGGDPPTLESVSSATPERVSISAASSAGEAVARITREGSAVDCLVTVQDLPDGTGLELLGVVRERWPDLPVVLFPAAGSHRLAVATSRVGGITRYLPQSIEESQQRLLEGVIDATAEADRIREYRRESNMFSSLMDEIPVSIYFKDEAARHVRVTPAVGTDTTATSPIGKTDPELYADEIGEQAWESYADDVRVIETGESIVDKEEAWAADIPDVDTLWLRSTKIPWRDESGDIRGLIGVTRDISELKHREAELDRKKRRLDRFASFVSHDLRNPLNVALGYLELGREDGDDESLAEVERALDRIGRLIDDLLHMAHQDVGFSSTGVVRFADIVEEIWDEVTTPAATLRMDVPDGAIVNADERLLRQLLTNLFHNAIEHVGSDATVLVGTTETGFYVEDDGPGIHEDDRERIFEFGYSGADSGTGMGLAFVHQIAEAHGWRMAVDAGNRLPGARFEVSNCMLVRRPRPAERAGTPVPFRRQRDVGDARPQGGAAYDPKRDRFTVRGGGTNVWLDVDECHFVHAPLAGDGRIVARVVDVEAVEPHSKAGVMVRASPEAGAPMGYVGASPGPATELLWRSGATDDITSRQLDREITLPRWYRLDVVDERVTCYTSSDGEDWIPIDERPIDRDGTVAAGLAVCSHDPGQLCEGVFEDVSIVEF